MLETNTSAATLDPTASTDTAPNSANPGSSPAEVATNPDPTIPTARLVDDMHCDLSVVPDEYRSKVSFIARKKRAVPMYLKGTEFTGDHAIALVINGQATPTNDACALGCGMSAVEIAAQQVEYRMDALGIKKPEHRDLYRGGVITGYDRNGKKIPGPNFDSWQKAQEAAGLNGNV